MATPFGVSHDLSSLRDSGPTSLLVTHSISCRTPLWLECYLGMMSTTVAREPRTIVWFAAPPLEVRPFSSVCLQVALQWRHTSF